LNSRPKVWVLEDDPALEFVYQEILGVRYNLRFFSNLATLRAAFGEYSSPPSEAPVLIIADLRLPDGSFWSLLVEKPWATRWPGLPVIVVSSVDDVSVLQDSFLKGASDYLVKPFHASELTAKTQRWISQPLFAIPHMDLDMEGHCLRRAGYPPVTLTVKEFLIISALNTSPAGLPRRDLMKKIWSEVQVTPKALDVQLFKLRRKLRPLGLDIRYGEGGRFSLSSHGMQDA